MNELFSEHLRQEVFN